MTPIRELLQDLALPVRSFRLFALETLLREGKGPEVIQGLESHLRRETDAECRVVAEFALRAVQARTTRGDTMPAAPAAPLEATAAIGEFASRFPHLTPDAQLEALAGLSPALLSGLSEAAADWLAATTEPMLMATLLRTFRTVWPRDRLKDLPRALGMRSLMVRLAALETLVTRAPEELRHRLPALLVHEDPRIRALGVRGLVAIDESEAVAHLTRMLASPQPETVLAGLRCSVFLPFDRVRGPILQALDASAELTVLDRLAVFLANNPDPEVPYRLAEIEERTTGPKRDLVRRLSDEVMENLRRAGSLGQDWPKFQAGFAAWRHRRPTRRQLRDLLRRWTVGAVTIEEAAGFLALRWSDPDLREALPEILAEVTDPDVKQTVEGWLKAGTIPVAPAASGAPAACPPSPTGAGTPAVPPAVDPCEDLLDRIARLTPERQAEARTLLLPLLASPATLPRPVLAAVIRAAHRTRLADATPLIRPLLEVTSPVTATPALEFLADFDFDHLMPRLGTFLKAEAIRLRGAALRVLQEKDPKRSLSALRAMLEDPTPGVPRTALGCLAVFDFFQVRDLIVALLKRTPNDQVFREALLFFTANPELDNLYPLYGLERLWESRGRQDRSSQARQARRDNLDFLTANALLLPGAVADLDAAFADRWDREQAAGRSPKPYGVDTLYPDEKSGGSRDGLPTLLTLDGLFRLLTAPVAALAEGWRTFPKTTATLVILVLVALAGFFREGPRPMSGNQPQPVPARIMTVEGRVESVAEDAMMVKGDGGMTYLLQPPGGRIMPNLPIGSQVKATLVPFRQESAQIIRAECREILLIE
ncbi:MAG: HEAT repeat domain-containing protein [Candidatus Riflebacteria bacterium]|nr:HEAT repeat domain-containing protein [Candidatus Riflebacteria bacterium]